MEEIITFQSEDNQLEGLLGKGEGDKGIVITHPHPLYGGNMYNAVVETIMRAYREKGFTTLRFNFRGVSRSRGAFDDGIGEQTDVIAARSYLKEMAIDQVDLVGYSFGAWINAMAGCFGSMEHDMIMVSPPVAFVDFSPISSLPCLKRVVTGSRDDFAPADQIRTMLTKWNETAQLDIVAGADHFYGGYLSELAAVLFGYP